MQFSEDKYKALQLGTINYKKTQQKQTSKKHPTKGGTMQEAPIFQIRMPELQ